MQLNVSEWFYSIQGEGRTIGQPSYFLRLTACNLICGGIGTQKDGQLHNGATWRCDSIEVWTKGKKYSFDELIEAMGGNDFIVDLIDGAHLIITGGEPMLQQDEICLFIKEVQRRMDGQMPVVEIETNGTIYPREIINYIRFWNISPKLSNSGETFKRRMNETAIRVLSKYKGTTFKFVVTNDSDFDEIQSEWLPKIGNRSKLILMPGADNREDLDQIREKVIKLCMERKIRFSDRLHITTWNRKTGV